MQLAKQMIIGKRHGARKIARSKVLSREALQELHVHVGSASVPVLMVLEMCEFAKE